jgi:phosphoribosylglycinamide formyltransferase-1
MGLNGEVILELPTKIAILASGNGTNAVNIINTVKEKCRNLEVVVLVCDNPTARVISSARELNIHCVVINSKELNKEEFETSLITTLDEYNIEWVLLAGFMRVLSPHFVDRYTHNNLSYIVNIHPSLLPLYPGLNSYERAFYSNDSHSGVTLHFVDYGIDTGKIIFQKKFPRLSSDSLDQFKRRGLNCEYELYSKFLIQLDKGNTHKFFKEQTEVTNETMSNRSFI